jgi:hypothetical protein
MSSPEEMQLADDLRHIVAGQPFTLDIEAIARRARRQHRRGLVTRGLAGVTVLGLAVAGGVIATARTGSPGETAGQAAGQPAAKAPVVKTPVKAPVETVAYVRQQVEAAQSPADYLIRTEQAGNNAGDPSQAVTIWTDPATGNTMLLQGSGQAKLTYWEHDYYKNRVLHWDQTQVNYGPRTWWTYDMSANGPIQGPVPSGPVGGNYTPASEVKALLSDGDWKIAGHPVVDGHHTVELSFSVAGVISKIWADASTYQVVRTLKQMPRLPAITADYYWVPKTAAKASLINNPQIPAGYTKVAYGS